MFIEYLMISDSKSCQGRYKLRDIGQMCVYLILPKEEDHSLTRGLNVAQRLLENHLVSSVFELACCKQVFSVPCDRDRKSIEKTLLKTISLG